MAISDLPQDLDHHLSGPDPDWLDDDQQPIVPAADKAEADRWLRKLARLQHQADEIDDLYRLQLQQLQAWRDERLGIIARQQDRLEQSLESFHAAVLDLDPKAKTLTLPAGTLKARAQQPEWRIDEPVFVEWAQQHAPELLNVPPPPAPKPDRAAIKKALVVQVANGLTRAVTPDAEVVPGVEVTHRGPKFTAEPNREAVTS